MSLHSQSYHVIHVIRPYPEIMWIASTIPNCSLCLVGSTATWSCSATSCSSSSPVHPLLHFIHSTPLHSLLQRPSHRNRPMGLSAPSCRRRPRIPETLRTPYRASYCTSHPISHPRDSTANTPARVRTRPSHQVVTVKLDRSHFTATRNGNGKRQTTHSLCFASVASHRSAHRHQHRHSTQTQRGSFMR